jgi:DNA polymerase III subunit beta
MEINLKALLTTLEANAKVLSGNKVIPAYENILFEIVEGACKITTSDGKIRVTTKMFIDKTITQSFMIYGKTFLETLRLIDSETVILDVKDNEIIVKAGKSKYKMPSFNASNYPVSPKLENPKTVTISNAVELVSHITQCVKFVNVNDLRPALTAISLSSKDGKILIQGSNAYIMYSGSIDNNDEITECLLYHACSNVLDSIKEEQEVSVHTSEKTVVFEGKSIEISVTLVEGKFPISSIESFLKIEGQKILLNKIQFTKQVKRALLYANNITKSIAFKVEDNELSIQATDIDFNKESKDVMEYTNIDSTGFKISLDGSKLLTCLNSLNDEEVIFLVKDYKTLALVQGKESGVFTAISPVLDKSE